MQSNEQIIRRLYALAEGEARDSRAFAAMFTEDGYFFDVPAGVKYYGEDIGAPVDVYAAAFPDIHRELFRLYATGDVVVVELALQGTHRGDLPVGDRVLAATGRRMDAPCCDVFHLRDGKVASFHCYNLPSVALQQLGVLGNLEAALS